MKAVSSQATFDLKPYPAMKRSGVLWLGDIPVHWKTRPLKRWVTMNADVLPETTPHDRTFEYVDIGAVGTGVLTEEPQSIRFGSAPSRARRVVHQGDTLVSTVRTYLKAVYFVDRATSSMICSTGFAVLTPLSGTIPKFVSYVVQSKPFTDRVTAESVGTAYPAIAETRLGSFRVAIPPLEEQIPIVRFLDHVDRRIHQFMRAKQNLIKLLEEQKRVVLHHAVTRGIEEGVSVKPSGIPWVGDIPEHWDVVPNRSLLRLRKQVVGDRAEKFTLLSLTKRGVIPRDLENPEGKFPMSFDTYQAVEPGDLIFCLFDIDETPRAVGQAMASGMVTGAYTRFEPRNAAAGRFIHLYYTAMDDGKRLKPLYTGLRKVITKSAFLSAKMPLPPASERDAIVHHVQTVTAQANAAIDRTRKELLLLREYQVRLITDVVTGRLDVRAAATRLPKSEAEAGEGMSRDLTSMDKGEDVMGEIIR